MDVGCRGARGVWEGREGREWSGLKMDVSNGGFNGCVRGKKVSREIIRKRKGYVCRMISM